MLAYGNTTTGGPTAGRCRKDYSDYSDSFDYSDYSNYSDYSDSLSIRFPIIRPSDSYLSGDVAIDDDVGAGAE